MTTDAEYLKALADELMCPCMEADLDKEDGQRLYRIAEAHDKLEAERDRLRAAVTWIAEQEENICEDCALREGIVSRCQVALLKEVEK